MTKETTKEKAREAGFWTVGGAAAGFAASQVIGGIGVAVLGTAVGVGVAPVVALGAVAGLAGFGVKKVFDK